MTIVLFKIVVRPLLIYLSMNNIKNELKTELLMWLCYMTYVNKVWHTS